jgi:hypothetical protein
MQLRTNPRTLRRRIGLPGHATIARRVALRQAVALPTLAVLVLIGCGPRSDRLAVSGNVSLDGAPLDSGSIRFSSVGGEKLVSSGAVIKEGAYHVPQEKGLLAGTYHVEITSPDTKAPPIKDTASGMLAAPERIPASYNVDSKRSIEVTSDGDNAFDFNISTSGE